jgi:hypothetical protein
MNLSNEVTPCCKMLQTTFRTIFLDQYAHCTDFMKLKAAHAMKTLQSLVICLKCSRNSENIDIYRFDQAVKVLQSGKRLFSSRIKSAVENNFLSPVRRLNSGPRVPTHEL